MLSELCCGATVVDASAVVQTNHKHFIKYVKLLCKNLYKKVLAC